MSNVDDLNTLDVAVIGGGAAGLSAALVLARARRRVLAIDAAGQRNAPAEHMHGFLSRDGLAPLDLVAIGRAEVAGYGGEFAHDTVTSIKPKEIPAFGWRSGIAKPSSRGASSSPLCPTG